MGRTGRLTSNEAGRQPFENRTAAGRELATALAGYRGQDGTVLALPRGGVPIAAPVATALHLRLDLLLVRKLGLPTQPELAMGAVAGIGGDLVLVRNDEVLASARVPADVFERVRRREEAELRRRTVQLRGTAEPLELTGLVILVDDGLATGSSMRAAITALSHAARPPATVVVAVPVGSETCCAQLQPGVQQIVCLWTPEPFYAVGQAYRDFRQTSDQEVRSLLAAAR